MGTLDLWCFGDTGPSHSHNLSLTSVEAASADLEHDSDSVLEFSMWKMNNLKWCCQADNGKTDRLLCKPKAI